MKINKKEHKSLGKADAKWTLTLTNINYKYIEWTNFLWCGMTLSFPSLGAKRPIKMC